MRPGRLDTILYVGPPDLEARREILKIKTRKMSIHSDIDLEELAVLVRKACKPYIYTSTKLLYLMLYIQTEGYSGAELVNICDEATHYAMRESLDIEAVGRRHFDIAREKSVRQITPQMKRFYEEWSVGGVRKIS